MSGKRKSFPLSLPQTFRFYTIVPLCFQPYTVFKSSAKPALYILIEHVSWNYWIGPIKHYYRATSNNELKSLCSGYQLLLRRPQNQIHQHFQVKFFVFKFGGIRWPLFYRQQYKVLSIDLSSHPYLPRCTAEVSYGNLVTYV